MILIFIKQYRYKIFRFEISSTKQNTKFQLEDLDLEVFYHGAILTQNSDILIKNAIFNWGRELTHDEKLKLHAAQKSKGKGKGKKTLRSDPIQPEDTVFCLYDINLKIRKVISSVHLKKFSRVL